MIAVVIPSYKVKRHILDVIKSVGSEVDKIYIIDDHCPEGSGKFVLENNTDSRVQVIFSKKNGGVGAAVLKGYEIASAEGAKVIVKIDGDGQMDCALIPKFIEPIISKRANYTKGNRFYSIEDLQQMPAIRLIGNAALSFINKIVSGYWNIMDPTNGFTAIDSSIIKFLPKHKISKRYFFESDMLFRLNTFKAVVQDIPMTSKYADEKSNLSVINTLVVFPRKYLIRFLKRIFYNYFLRDFNMGSISLLSGVTLLFFGLTYGLYHWYLAWQTHTATPAGTVMLATLPLILGFQSLLFFFQVDINNIPDKVI
jgi:glycosyltransferase involved in cell wall biosynthesis